MKILNYIFYVFAGLCIITAIYHVVGIFYPVNEAPPLRHALFVGINLFLAYGILKRPKWFVVLFGILMLQQFYSHGKSFIDMWQQQHAVDWISAGVLIAMPVMFVLLIIDARKPKA